MCVEFPLWNETWVDRLRRNLLLKYDKFSRPAQHYDTTTLFVYLNIMHVEAVRFKMQELIEYIAKGMCIA